MEPKPIEIKGEYTVLVGLREVNKTMREMTGTDVGVGFEVPMKMTLTLTPKAGVAKTASDELKPGSVKWNEIVRTMGRELKASINRQGGPLEALRVEHAELGRIDDGREN
jgi:hypothetical protein